jgi:hypothetical protein
MQRELSRRSLLAGTAAAATASAGTGVLRADSRGAIGIASDAELLDLTQDFARAHDAYQAARDHYNHCENGYFARRPRVPEALTESGPLGHLLPSWLHWSAAELRQILKNPEHRDVWDQARAALALAKAYEAGARRAKRETGAAAAEAAHDAAIDHIAEVSQSILAAPGRSLARLALKAHVVKTWGKSEWWEARDDRADTYERLAAQILDAVIVLAETGKVAPAPSLHAQLHPQSSAAR